MEYARIAARRFATEHREYYVTPDDVLKALPMVAAEYDQPFGNSSAVPAYYCARLAHGNGIARLLAGDGGDELFGGNARYARQYQFSLYEKVPSLLRTGFLEPVAAHRIGGPRAPAAQGAKLCRPGAPADAGAVRDVQPAGAIRSPPTSSIRRFSRGSTPGGRSR